MSEAVLREDRGNVVVLTLNRPRSLNALCGAVFDALDEHLTDIARQKQAIGLVVLRGAGGNFSAGYDLAEVAVLLRAHAKPHVQAEVIEKLAALPQPVIAAVEGQCSTGAMEMALAADLIVAAESARFSDRSARWGLTPIWGMTLRLPLRVGAAKAREMVLTGRVYDGREAAGFHLANFCFADNEFEAGLQRVSAEILGNSWFANRVIKRTLIETEGLTLRAMRALEILHNEGVAPDAQDRVATFLNRPPRQD